MHLHFASKPPLPQHVVDDCSYRVQGLQFEAQYQHTQIKAQYLNPDRHSKFIRVSQFAPQLILNLLSD